MKKLRGSRGVTLTETLCTVLIVLLISAMLYYRSGRYAGADGSFSGKTNRCY